MFYKACDRTATKHVIRDWLQIMAEDAGREISHSKANRLADKFKRGLFDPELIPVTEWSDPTGERATDNVMREWLKKNTRSGVCR